MSLVEDIMKMELYKTFEPYMTQRTSPNEPKVNLH